MSHPSALLALALGGTLLMARGSSAEAKGPGATFAKLTDQFMRESLALSPVNASQAGYHSHRDGPTGRTRELDAELDDLSPGGYVRQRDFYRTFQARFEKETPLASLEVQDAADWQLIQDQIALNLLELDRIQSHRHNPTGCVELIGNALFLPLTQEYAPPPTRLRHVLARLAAVPRALDQARQTLADADPIFVKVAIDENAGNVDLIETTLAAQVPAGSPLRPEYDKTAPPAVAALKDFSRWLEQDLGRRKPSRTWRLGPELYAAKFKYVMETSATPEAVLADAQREMKAVRAEMLELALPRHKEEYPGHTDHSELAPRDRENKIIGEVLDRIALDHPKRDALLQAVEGDLAGITAFIREKQIVSLGTRENLKVIPTPPFMRGIYSVAGFHAAPPLEPTAEAQYWVTPIDPGAEEARAESRLSEYNTFVLKWLTIHEALPGHYVQAEHANNVQPETRRLVRNLFGNGPYVEGWAEYIAQVMMDEGFLGDEQRFRLSMRKIRLRVLANAILDVLLQTRGMSDADALELMTGEAFQTQAEAEGKLQRAKLSSAQLPTYYVGLRDWLALRRAYELRQGRAFDLKEFHDRVLDQGPLPLPLLEKVVLR